MQNFLDLQVDTRYFYCLSEQEFIGHFSLEGHSLALIKLRSDILFIPTVPAAEDQPRVRLWAFFCSMLHIPHYLLFFILIIGLLHVGEFTEQEKDCIYERRREKCLLWQSPEHKGIILEDTCCFATIRYSPCSPPAITLENKTGCRMGQKKWSNFAGFMKLSFFLQPHQ